MTTPAPPLNKPVLNTNPVQNNYPVLRTNPVLSLPNTVLTLTLSEAEIKKTRIGGHFSVDALGSEV